MDPPKINYVNNNSIMVINNYGSIRQLFVPFKVKVIHATAILVKDAWVVVDEVQQSDKYLLLYRIGRNWWPYYVFKLSVEF
jgi:signal peptidase I